MAFDVMKVSDPKTMKTDLWVLLVHSQGFIPQFIPKPFLQVRICDAHWYKLLSFSFVTLRCRLRIGQHHLFLQGCISSLGYDRREAKLPLIQVAFGFVTEREALYILDKRDSCTDATSL
jgi:hypothetical protein